MITSISEKEGEVENTNIPDTVNLKNYIQSLNSQGKGMLMGGAIQMITSLRADGIMFEKNFKKEFFEAIGNIQKELNEKPVDFSIGVLSAIILLIIESDVKKETPNFSSRQEDITNSLLGYI